MTKPKLLVLHGKKNFEIPTFAESAPVRKGFDITKTQAITGKPDLVYCQSYVQCRAQLTGWTGPCVIPLGGTMDFEGSKAKQYGKVLTQNKNRTLTFMSEWLMDDFNRRRLDCGEGAHMTYLPGGHWGMDHTISGVQVSRFHEKNNYRLGDPPTVLMSLTLSGSIELGRWQKCRGIPIFLDAVKSVTEKYQARFICAGMREKDFPYLNRWERDYNFLSVRSHYKVDAVDKWPDRLVAADVFVHPSLYDGWARVPAEAMCAAIPVMMFGGPSIPQTGDTVVWCDPDDPLDTAHVLDGLLGDQDLRENIGKTQRAEALMLTERHRGDLAKVMLGALS